MMQSQERPQLTPWGALEIDGPSELSLVRTREHSSTLPSHCMWAAVGRNKTLDKVTPQQRQFQRELTADNQPPPLQ